MRRLGRVIFGCLDTGYGEEILGYGILATGNIRLEKLSFGLQVAGPEATRAGFGSRALGETVMIDHGKVTLDTIIMTGSP